MSSIYISKTEYDALKAENKELKEENAVLREQNLAMNKTEVRLIEKNKELKEKLERPVTNFCAGCMERQNEIINLREALEKIALHTEDKEPPFCALGTTQMARIAEQALKGENE